MLPPTKTARLLVNLSRTPAELQRAAAAVAALPSAEPDLPSLRRHLAGMQRWIEREAARAAQQPPPARPR
jgi:hypothetical protein